MGFARRHPASRNAARLGVIAERGAGLGGAGGTRNARKVTSPNPNAANRVIPPTPTAAAIVAAASYRETATQALGSSTYPLTLGDTYGDNTSYIGLDIAAPRNTVLLLKDGWYQVTVYGEASSLTAGDLVQTHVTGACGPDGVDALAAAQGTYSLGCAVSPPFFNTAGDGVNAIMYQITGTGGMGLVEVYVVAFA